MIDSSASDIPQPPERFNFARHLVELNAARAGRPAYIDDAGTLSYGELADRVRRCAARSVCGKREESVVCDLPVRCPAGTCARCKLAPSAERCRARRGTVVLENDHVPESPVALEILDARRRG